MTNIKQIVETRAGWKLKEFLERCKNIKLEQSTKPIVDKCTLIKHFKLETYKKSAINSMV